MFQTSDPVLHHLRGEVDRLLRSILSDFMKFDIVRSCDPFTVSIDDLNLMVPIDKVYIGINATETLHELIEDEPEAACMYQDVKMLRKIVWHSCWRS